MDAKTQYTLASQVYEAIWTTLHDQLAPDQRELFFALDSLGLAMRQGDVPHQVDLGESIDEALDVLPEAAWPDDVYTLLPEREAAVLKRQEADMWAAVKTLAVLPGPMHDQARRMMRELYPAA